MAKKTAPKKTGTKKGMKRKAVGAAHPKSPAEPPVKPVKTRIGAGTTRTPRTLPATGE